MNATLPPPLPTCGKNDVKLPVPLGTAVFKSATLIGGGDGWSA